MSTLETAIVFTAVLTFITFLITGTEELAINSLEAARDGSAETQIYLSDSGLLATSELDGLTVYDASAEKLCTYLSGLSDNYRIVYGSVSSAADSEAGDTDE